MGLENIFNQKTILLMVLSAIVGFSVNYYSTKLANDKLLASLTDQYNAIIAAQHTAKGIDSAALEKKKSDLQAQIRILSEK